MFRPSRDWTLRPFFAAPAFAIRKPAVAVFTLDNGQVWIEITPDGDLMSNPGDTVKLSRGLLNSYWLQNRNGRGAKVHRVL